MSLLNDYKIIKELGAGGMGKTYLVQMLKLPGKPIRVLKHLKPAQPPKPEQWQFLQRLFKKEAAMLAHLGHHPQIPTLHDYLHEYGEFFLVQEYIQGNSLAEEIKSNTPLNEKQVLFILEEILEVLKFVHEQDAIHLDLKPDNIMRRTLDRKVILIDFGGAKQTSALHVTPNGNTVMTVCVGTPGYMPPEQSQGRPKPASDIYAVGKIAIQALTGRCPHLIPQDSYTDEVLWQSLVNGISRDFARVIDKMISYKSKDRYKDASEALNAVRDLKAKIHDPLNLLNHPFTPRMVPGLGFTPNFTPIAIGQDPDIHQVKPKEKTPNLFVGTPKNKDPNIPGRIKRNKEKEKTPNLFVEVPKKKTSNPYTYPLGSGSFWYVISFYTTTALLQVVLNLSPWTLVYLVSLLIIHITLSCMCSRLPLLVITIYSFLAAITIFRIFSILITIPLGEAYIVPAAMVFSLMYIASIISIFLYTAGTENEDQVFSMALLVVAFTLLGSILGSVAKTILFG